MPRWNANGVFHVTPCLAEWTGLFSVAASDPAQRRAILFVQVKEEEAAVLTKGFCLLSCKH